ncbi:GNAT family N-acetyltransferase [Nesterenkonia suensis]
MSDSPTPESTEDGVEVVNQADQTRFAILVDGALAGFAEYRSARDGSRSFTHTEIGEAHQGRGLASQLVRQALDQTRAEGLSVLPYCPLVRSFIAKHASEEDGGYLDLVPQGRRADFSLPEA